MNFFENVTKQKIPGRPLMNMVRYGGAVTYNLRQKSLGHLATNHFFSLIWHIRNTFAFTSRETPPAPPKTMLFRGKVSLWAKNNID